MELKSFSTLEKILFSINETSVELRLVSDYESDNYEGLKMTVKLEDYGKGGKVINQKIVVLDSDCVLEFSRSLENARKPKSMMKKNN